VIAAFTPRRVAGVSARGREDPRAPTSGQGEPGSGGTRQAPLLGERAPGPAEGARGSARRFGRLHPLARRGEEHAASPNGHVEASVAAVAAAHSPHTVGGIVRRGRAAT